MLVASTSMVKINGLAKFAWMFHMKDLGTTKQFWAWIYTKMGLMVSFLVITMRVHGMIHRKFGMNDVK